MREAYGIILAGGQARRLGGSTRLDRRWRRADPDTPRATAWRPVCRPGAQRQWRCRALRGLWPGRSSRTTSRVSLARLLRSGRDGLRRSEFRANFRYRHRPRRHALHSARSRGAALKSAGGGGADIAVARSGERDHHAIALWPVTLRANCDARWWRRNCARWLLLPNDLSTSRWSGRSSRTIRSSMSTAGDVERARRWRLKHSPDQSPPLAPATPASAASARARTPD